MPYQTFYYNNINNNNIDVKVICIGQIVELFQWIKMHRLRHCHSTFILSRKIHKTLFKSYLPAKLKF